MTTFDKREEAFEKRFAIEEELRFKAEARRNRQLGLWAAELLGKGGPAADAYARDVIAAQFEQGGDASVVRKVARDLAAKGTAIGEREICAKMDELMGAAIAQLKSGM